ncbi:MAG: METTL5 family protein [Candidatus Bathyarchaeota archaeon]|nr:METTL5 family protein [Candidatus Bathyarchaeota archaeon]
MLRRKHLALILSRLEPPPHPKLKWEVYKLDAESAANMVYTAAWIYDDVRGKKVVDLGCGSGVLAIAASLLGAELVVGVDIDKDSIMAAVRNAEMVGADVDFVVGDINCVGGHFHTTLMNPPFGSWHKGSDVRFLKKALEISDVVYSIHKRSQSVREFLGRCIPQLGGLIDHVYEMDIIISRTYDFHRRRRYIVKADLYRILSGKVA